MIIHVTFNNRKYKADLSAPIDISIPLRNGDENPNCYFAEPVKMETIRTESFVGSVEEGGNVNYQKVTFTPHGNGTHTECYGHITASGATINQSLIYYHFIAELISVNPESRKDGDTFISKDEVLKSRKYSHTDAVIIRTTPNTKSKITRYYSNTNPPFFEKEVMELLVEQGVQHFLTDLPSVDKEYDEGKLISHKTFWGLPIGNARTHCTITELIYVDNDIPDGLYLLNLQIPSFEMDSAPSKPVIYKLNMEN